MSEILGTPIGDRILVKPDEKQNTLGDFVIPDQGTKDSQTGIVMETGPGSTFGDEMQVKKGDRVLFSDYSTTKIKIKGQDYRIMRETDIYFIFPKSTK